MKKSIFILLIIAAAMIFVSCGKANVIVLKDMNGNDIEVSTQGMTDNQIEALESVASGESNIMDLIMGGLFTPNDFTEMGVGTRGGMNSSQVGMMKDRDFSDQNVEDLNLDGLNQQQIDALDQIINGELTVQKAIQGGVLSMEDIIETGLVSELPQGNGQRGEPAN